MAIEWPFNGHCGYQMALNCHPAEFLSTRSAEDAYWRAPISQSKVKHQPKGMRPVLDLEHHSNSKTPSTGFYSNFFIFLNEFICALCLLNINSNNQRKLRILSKE